MALPRSIKRDLALNFIFKEGDLLTVARLGLTGFKKMEAEGIDIRAINRHGARIAAIVKSAKQTPADDYPAKIERLMDYPGYKQIFKNMKDVVKVASQKSGLATSVRLTAMAHELRPS